MTRDEWIAAGEAACDAQYARESAELLADYDAERIDPDTLDRLSVQSAERRDKGIDDVYAAADRMTWPQ